MDKFNINDLSSFEKGIDKKLSINGEKNREYQSYKFPITELYYNDLNGRIASYIEEYNDTHEDNVAILKETDLNSYNEKISKFIIDSAADNGKSFKATSEDIREKGQQVPGVILTDGRIIDGNRRFTALRKLYDETGNPRFSYFEAVCLKAPDSNDKEGWKTIKSLELNLQFNVDEKKGYNRIDELVSFYRDVMDPSTKMFDEKSYCFASGLTKSKFNNNIKVVTIMLEYLEWRGKPRAFYILKKEKLDGPIEDIAKATTKMSEDEWNSKKETIYQYMTISDEGDRTRNIRELLKSAKTEGKIYEKVRDMLQSENVVNQVIDFMENIDKISNSSDETAKRKKNKAELKNQLNIAYNDGKYLETEKNANDEPSNILEKVLKMLNEIDKPSIRHLTDESKKDFAAKLDGIKLLIKELEDAQ